MDSQANDAAFAGLQVYRRQFELVAVSGIRVFALKRVGRCLVAPVFGDHPEVPPAARRFKSQRDVLERGQRELPERRCLALVFERTDLDREVVVAGEGLRLAWRDDRELDDLNSARRKRKFWPIEPHPTCRQVRHRNHHAVDDIAAIVDPQGGDPWRAGDDRRVRRHERYAEPGPDREVFASCAVSFTGQGDCARL